MTRSRQALSILVVDDDAHMREFIADVALEAGHRVEAVPSGSDMRQRLIIGLPDMLILDLLMPDKDGIECLQWISEVPGGRTVPVLMISGTDRSLLSVAVDLGQAHGLNMKGILSKPFSAAELEAYFCTTKSVAGQHGNKEGRQ